MMVVEYGNNTFSQTEEKLHEVIDVFRNVGKAKIHELYQLPDSMEVDNGCELSDIKISESTYNEYFDGMTKFIREVLSIDDRDTDIANRFNTELNNAKEKDKSFIDGLFVANNNNNCSCVCIMKNNMDYLCDVKDTINRYQLGVKALTDSFNYSDSEVKKNSVKFMESSVNYFLQSILSHIDKSLHVMVDNKEKIVEKVDDRKFCLFI